MPKATIITEESTSLFVNRISREYGMYVLYNRAIPSMTDGLKVGQRIALWLMRNRQAEIKTAAMAGAMLESNLYVHGSKPAEDTISYLAAPFLNNHPLIQGEGQFGSRVAPSTGIGAARYTEVKRSKFAEQNLYIDHDILPMIDNYDGSAQMPRTFLPLLPLVLLNGVKGVAVGFATLILPRRLSDLRSAVQEVLETGRVQTKLRPHYDQYDVEVIQDHSKPNRWIVRGRLQIKNTSTVKITELPPDLALTAFRDHLIDLEEAGTIRSFIDNTTDQVDIEIKMSRASLEKYTEDGLIELFKLRTFQTENIVVVNESGDGIRQYRTAEELVEDFVKWRLGWYERRYQNLIEKAQVESIFWKVFVSCFPEVARKISMFKSRDVMRQAVRSAGETVVDPTDLDEHPEVVDKIVSLPAYRWTKEGRKAAETRLSELEAEIREYQDILSSPERQKQIYLKEVTDV